MKLALIGDPVFDDVDERMPARATAAVTHGPGGAAYESDRAAPALARLPFSSREVEQIAGLVAENERMVITGFDASKDAVIGTRLADFQYVHLATHGIIDAEQPALSSLVLSLRDRTGSVQNGYLRLHDIYGMKLNADLVVLSACDTALGREIRGEGLIGLTQGFLYAGTASVVASLWQVPDKATAELMTRFYRNLLEKEQRPAKALRTAQLELAEDRRWRDPYYWSGFVVQGEWR
jgi:CHAT domain-containing protein